MSSKPISRTCAHTWWFSSSFSALQDCRVVARQEGLRAEHSPRSLKPMLMCSEPFARETIRLPSSLHSGITAMVKGGEAVLVAALQHGFCGRAAFAASRETGKQLELRWAATDGSLLVPKLKKAEKKLSEALWAIDARRR